MLLHATDYNKEDNLSNTDSACSNTFARLLCWTCKLVVFVVTQSYLCNDRLCQNVNFSVGHLDVLSKAMKNWVDSVCTVVVK